MRKKIFISYKIKIKIEDLIQLNTIIDFKTIPNNFNNDQIIAKIKFKLHNKKLCMNKKQGKTYNKNLYKFSKLM